MYKTGIETKIKITDTAKRLFYRQGYKGTSINQICLEADVKLGTFTYYFPKKDDLLSVLYSSYMQSCADYVNGKRPGLAPAQHHLFSVMMYYQNIYSDERIAAFHREVMEIASMNNWFHDTRRLISSYSGNDVTGLDTDFYDLCVRADNAVRRELNLDFMREGKTGREDVRALLFDIYTLNAKLFNVDKDLTYKYLDEAYDFYLSEGNGDIRLL